MLLAMVRKANYRFFFMASAMLLPSSISSIGPRQSVNHMMVPTGQHNTKGTFPCKQAQGDGLLVTGPAQVI